jgi:probable phosphoglycerate mutase
VIELVFVRHAQPDWEPGGLARDEPELTELGRAQAERVAAQLESESFDAFYTSPLLRARETAAPIEKALGIAAQIEPWLAELRLRPLEGSPLDEVQKYFARMRLRELDEWWNGMEGGESFRHFHERVTTGIDELLGQRLGALRAGHGARQLWSLPETSARVLVTAHGGSIAVALAHLLGIEPVAFEAERFRVGWAGICRVRSVPVSTGHIFALEAFNARAHLSGLPDPPG